MNGSTPCRHYDGESTHSSPGQMPESVWDEKWHNMVLHQKLRKEQDARLRQKLKEEREMEEFIECTFTPKTHGRSKNRTSEEVLRILKPLIGEEERILQELARIDNEEEAMIQQLSIGLRRHIAITQGCETEQLIHLCEQYREERLKEISKVKNLKLDVVGLLHEVERKFNLICVKEGLTEDDTERAGFSIESCRRIKKEILESIKGVDTLKDRSKVTSEIDAIIRKAKEDVERHRIQMLNNQFVHRSMGAKMPIHPRNQLPFVPQVPYMAVNPRVPFRAPAMNQNAPQIFYPQGVPQVPNAQPGTLKYLHQPVNQIRGTQDASMVQPVFSGGLNQFVNANTMQPRQPVMLQRNVGRKLVQ
ncbi:hypothetical protein BBOV_II002720 [Babesia bovis T2Bo]|uniref:Uncharacterized protein n=1 Tax=Babesia bovis TaxID=5865 RepID=A7ATG5_BABBO|nr:hypothetical protein BBOV_II002720 [Babesia bovis T2Bo]EDO06226.1 hypothetical protein BBOV_II002720 [Babesia bovis T2Bo]|eukprot:XP_001609794.1 hypothetical protein [Babesia bovis T2Bo]